MLADGTKERVGLDVRLYTGLRRDDAVAIGREHARNGIATLRNERVERQITGVLPILPILKRLLSERLAFLAAFAVSNATGSSGSAADGDGTSGERRGKMHDALAIGHPDLVPKS